MSHTALFFCQRRHISRNHTENNNVMAFSTSINFFPLIGHYDYLENDKETVLGQHLCQISCDTSLNSSEDKHIQTICI